MKTLATIKADNETRETHTKALREKAAARDKETERRRRIEDAADDMLAVLKAIEAYHAEVYATAGKDESHSYTLRVARAAISKAEGKS